MLEKSLLDLAKTLGMVETIYCDGETAAVDQTNVRMTIAKEQAYNFLIVIDFEATCWQPAEVSWKQPEIIGRNEQHAVHHSANPMNLSQYFLFSPAEFPAILINLKTGHILSEFHKYLLPVEAPLLSAFCTNLTGILQTQIDTVGVPLPTCLMLFDKWLKDIIERHQLMLPKTSRSAMQGNCALATWSDWDLGICLLKECERKRIKKNAYFDQWVDIKYVYKKWYKYSPKNFSDALQHVGRVFSGREHSGIDDARNIAQLAHTMAREGAPIAITKDLKPFMVFNKV